MKMSRLFGETLRDAPAEADTVSHQLLLRAGFIRPLGAGIFSYLHLARRSLDKIEKVLRHEMDQIGGQEITMPVVQPAEIWKETGRWFQIGSEMGRFQDRNHHDMVLAMTHEEAVSDLVRREIHSYKQLPRLLYHIQTKFRDEPRPRAGLIRVREFTMKDSYSLDSDIKGLDRQYRAHYQAYFNIFRRCGLDIITVRSDPGMMGGIEAHEFMFLTPMGEDTLFVCDNCGYTANRQVARFLKTPILPEDIRELQEVHTPACKTIEDLVNFLGIPKSRTAKAVFFIAGIPDEGMLQENFIFAVIRGDLELNETKLANTIGASTLRPATEAEIRSIGAVPGFASPIGLKFVDHIIPVQIIIDDSIESSVNLVAGANKPDTHLINTNVPRDYHANIVADIAAAEDRFACHECGGPLHMVRGVEVGNIFKLGTRYSEAMNCTFLDKDGSTKPVQMGSYGIGVGRLLACVAEQHHDEYGLMWPVTIAPYQVHLVLLHGKDHPEAEEIAGRIYNDLETAGIEALFDDRQESPGVKFSDADLIGLPIRLTVSARALNLGGVELKLRHQAEKKIFPIETIGGEIRALIKTLEDEISINVFPVP